MPASPANGQASQQLGDTTIRPIVNDMEMASGSAYVVSRFGDPYCGRMDHMSVRRRTHLANKEA